jgi:hypothetical protein
MMAVAGCLGTGPPPPPPALSTVVTSSPVPGPDPAQARAVEEILAVYGAFRRGEDELSADPPPVDEAERRLAAHLGGALRTQVLLALHEMVEHGLARRGRPVSTARVAALRLDATPPTATVIDCLDGRGWSLVDRGTGTPPAGPAPHGIYAATPGRYVRTLTATRYDDGTWLLDGFDPPLARALTSGDEPC